MKKLFFFAAITIAFSVKGFAQPAPPPAPESADNILKAALKEAKKDNKKVFIMFHASWCGWCHKMDKSMNDDACKDYFEKNFVIRHLVVDESKDKVALENPGANEFRTKYYGDGQGIPFWLIFDKDGKLLSDSKIHKSGESAEGGQNIGCPANEEEVAFFIGLLKKYTDLNADQEAKIKTRFRANETN